MPGLTFASLLTPEGVVAAAAFITSIVALLKYTFPPLDARISGALLAFAFSAVLYVLAAFATGANTLDAGLALFVAWVSCATGSVGIHSAVSHVTAPATGGTP